MDKNEIGLLTGITTVITSTLITLGALLSAISAVVFWIGWTILGIGETYFNFLPVIYQVIPFWDCIGLFLVLGIAKSLIPTGILVNKGD
jgi:phage-related protein